MVNFQVGSNQIPRSFEISNTYFKTMRACLKYFWNIEHKGFTTNFYIILIFYKTLKARITILISPFSVNR